MSFMVFLSDSSVGLTLALLCATYVRPLLDPTIALPALREKLVSQVKLVFRFRILFVETHGHGVSLALARKALPVRRCRRSLLR
jgi:hypothetical protein